jgi:hypothetical protein
MSKMSKIQMASRQRTTLKVTCLVALISVLINVTAYAAQRSWQPLVIHGSALWTLSGQHEENLEVLAYRAGRLIPIPFQLDQVFSDGEFALPSGPVPVAGDHPGILGPRDEVVMMTSDLGGRLTDAGILPNNALEIEVANPLDGSDRYAYIAAAGSPQRSPIRYVSYQDKLHTVKTDAYLLTMKNELPESFTIGNGNASDHLARGFEAHAEARLLKMFPVHFSEKDVRSSIVAYKVGPIRVIRKIRHWLSLAPGIASPTVTRGDFFYPDSIDEPLVVDLPWVPGFLFDNIRVRFDMVLRGTSGLTLSWPDLRAPGVSLDDRQLRLMIQQHPKADRLALATKNGAVVGSFAPTSAINSLTVQLYYRDRLIEGGFSDAAALPRLGFLLTDWQHLSRGSHRVEFILVAVAKDYRGTRVQTELSTPPVIRIIRYGSRS